MTAEGLTRIAACGCGQLQAVCTGEPVRVAVCHCLACQRRTGSAFGVQARFATEQVAVSGKSRAWTRTGDEGSHITFRFCPDCGSTVFYTLDDVPGFVAVPVGGFADPDFPPPRLAIYEPRRHPWVSVRLASGPSE